MEEVAKKPTLLSVLFGNNEDSSNSIDTITDPRLIESNNNVNELGKQTTQPLVTEGNKSSKNGGISELKRKEEINNTVNKMRKTLGGNTLENQIRQSERNGRER